MFKLLRNALVLGALTLGINAQAQYTLEAISGVVSPQFDSLGIPTFASPASATSPNWGFGDPELVAGVTGQLQVATPDTFAGTSALGNLTGKIAIVYRGNNINFGTKALKCQQAGAIGVIIINNERPFVFTLSAGSTTTVPPNTDGANVTIPVIKVNRLYWRTTLKPALANGPVVMRIGGVLGRYANNLRLKDRFIIQPPVGHRPTFLVNDSGDVSFTPGASVFNFGSAASQNVKIKATVRRLEPNPAVIYSDSLLETVLNSGDTLQDDANQEPTLMTPFDLVTATPGLTDRHGEYELFYEASSDATDEQPSDNTYRQRFRVSDTTYSSTPLQDSVGAPDYFLPKKLGYSAPADNNNWSIGQPFNVQNINPAPAGFGWAAKRAIFYVHPHTGVTDSLAGLSISIDLLKWVDIDSNGLAANDETELTLVGQGVFDLTGNNQGYKPLPVTIFDALTQTEGALIEPNTRYIIRQAKDDDVAVTWFGTTQDVLDYQPWVSTNQGAIPGDASTNWPSFLWVGAAVDHNRFAGWPAPQIRTDFGLVTVASKEQIKPVTSLVYPNPASEKIQVSIGDKTGVGQAQIIITDATGKVVRTESRTLQGVRSHYFLSVADLNKGFYNVSVRTPNGSSTSRLVLTR